MRRLAALSAVFISLALAGLSGYMTFTEYGLWAIAVWAAMLAALPVSSLAHELGHILFGAAAGIKAVPEFRFFGSSSCKIVPKTDRNLKRRLMLTVCGGLIVNALLIVLGVVALAVSAVPVWLSLFLPANAYLFILNAFPVQFYSGKTDGLVWSELLKNTDESKVLLSVLTVQTQLLCGKSISEIDEKLIFDLPQIQEDDEAFISLTELRYEYFKAKGDDGKAAFYKKRFEELKDEYM